jgi:serine/threonine protein kinase
MANIEPSCGEATMLEVIKELGLNLSDVPRSAAASADGSGVGSTPQPEADGDGNGISQVASNYSGSGGQSRKQSSAGGESSKQALPSIVVGSTFKGELTPSELVLQTPLGSGAQAEVYKAIWFRSFETTTSAITVAVKRLHNHSEHAQRALICEGLTSDISHPNLVKCFEATQKPPFLIVSEYCAGGSLYDLIHEGSYELTWGQRLKILCDIAQGMEHLHGLKPKIIHRDLKSCNVLLTKQITSPGQTPTAKVSDFGLSRQLKNSGSVAASAANMTKCVGTWRWMAPEVFCSNEYDERIDVFSFGIMMFEVLARQIPYAETWPLTTSSNPRIGLHIKSGHRPDVSLVQSVCPNNVVQVMKACWTGESSQRPSFSTVRQQLQEQLELVDMYSSAIPSLK